MAWAWWIVGEVSVAVAAKGKTPAVDKVWGPVKPTAQRNKQPVGTAKPTPLLRLKLGPRRQT
jgi:hypothetical protein